jgi:hypothetical protein
MLAMRGGISIGALLTGAAVSLFGLQRALLFNGIIEPRQVSKREFYFDYREHVGWCWKEKRTSKAGDTAGLADQIMALLLDLHERFQGRERMFSDDE